MNSKERTRQRRSVHRRNMPVLPILLFLMLFIGMIWALLYYAKVKPPVEKTPVYPTMDALGPVYTDHSDEIIKIYIFTDPDTGYQYLVNDHGGITPRIRE